MTNINYFSNYEALILTKAAYLGKKDQGDTLKKYNLINIATIDPSYSDYRMNIAPKQTLTVAELPKTSEGLSASIFVKEINGQKHYSLSIAGTDGPRDWDDDLSIVLGNMPAQVSLLKGYWSYFKQKYNATGITEINGHSLGAYSAASLASLFPDDFNHITLVDGPGTKNIIERNIADIRIRSQFLEKISILNGAPNIVNSWGEHPQAHSFYYIRPTIQDFDTLSKISFSSYDWIMSGFKLHSVEVHINGYQQNKLTLVSDWPNGSDEFKKSYKFKVNSLDLTKGKIICLIDGEPVGKFKTGAIKMGDHYILKGSSKEEVAARLQIPDSWIVAEDTDTDMYPSFTGVKPFVIKANNVLCEPLNSEIDNFLETMYNDALYSKIKAEELYANKAPERARLIDLYKKDGIDIGIMKGIKSCQRLLDSEILGNVVDEICDSSMDFETLLKKVNCLHILAFALAKSSPLMNPNSMSTSELEHEVNHRLKNQHKFHANEALQEFKEFLYDHYRDFSGATEAAHNEL